jgi:hypothetical protein
MVTKQNKQAARQYEKGMRWTKLLNDGKGLGETRDTRVTGRGVCL